MVIDTNRYWSIKQDLVGYAVSRCLISRSIVLSLLISKSIGKYQRHRGKDVKERSDKAKKSRELKSVAMSVADSEFTMALV